MIIKRGIFYECATCKSELVATKSPKRCPVGDCALSCCGQKMNKVKK